MIDNLSQDLRSPQRQLIECQIAHADLDALIDQAVLAPLPLDELMLRRLKKKRLALRDQIAHLLWMIDPKEPA
jgi:hypothetical protein